MNASYVDEIRERLSETEARFPKDSFVRILPYVQDPYNDEGRVIGVSNVTGKVWVSNMNMPFSGSVNEYFFPEELEPLVF